MSASCYLSANAIAQLQNKLDFASGLVTVRAALEQIVTSAFPGKTATDALRCFCEAPDFQTYLDAVSAATQHTRGNLTKSAKGAYGMLSGPIHGGSTHSEGDFVPQAVLSDKCTLYAVAAIFKFTRRDICFYADSPAMPIKLPSPAHTPPRSAAPSPAQSPPKAAEAGGGGEVPAT